MSEVKSFSSPFVHFLPPHYGSLVKQSDSQSPRLQAALLFLRITVDHLLPESLFMQRSEHAEGEGCLHACWQNIFQVRFSQRLHVIRGQFAALHEREDVRCKMIYLTLSSHSSGSSKSLETSGKWCHRFRSFWWLPSVGGTWAVGVF